MREAADVRRALAKPRLLESPLAALRRRHGLNPDQAASRLGISVMRLARLETATRRLPVGTLAAIAERFGGPCQQLTIMDHVQAIVAAGEHAPTVGEGRCDG
jgi:transcriptional regulator with XRE-family HTH domain